MTENEVRRHLKEYAVDRATRDGLTISLGRVRRQLAAEESDTREVLAGAGGSQITGMPGAHRISSKVEDAAIKMIEEPTAEIKALREQEEQLQDRLTEAEEKCGLVEAWLGALNENERFVVDWRLIRCEGWTLVQDMYEDERGRFMSVGTLAGYCRNGLKKICRAAENVV